MGPRIFNSGEGKRVRAPFPGGPGAVVLSPDFTRQLDSRPADEGR